MAEALFAGAALGVAFDKLVSIVVQQAKLIAGFKSELQRLETTLKDIRPKLLTIMELKNVLNRPTEEKITRYLKDAADLVIKCSNVRSWNAYHKSVYAKKLISLDNDLVRFFQVNAQADAAITGLEISIEIGTMQKKLDQLLAAGTGGLSGWCSVPGLPELIVGLDEHLAELKFRLLKDETRVLVISAPGGCGKTTLAKMFCHDDEIKGTFGGNILYVTVSRVSSLMIIAQKLFKHYGENDHVFQTEEEAKNQIENLMRRKMGSDKMLLVLDDVWSESESHIQDLKFQIPGYKILVTSRFLFPRFNSTYQLSLLSHKDAKALLCYNAFPNNRNPSHVPDNLVNEMVKFCKNFPLALNLVGSLTCGQPVSKWRTILKKRSHGQSFLQSDSKLLLCLQTSLDALDELPIIRKCFLDLGSFPEDERITDTVLMDMWVELYNLEDEVMDSSEYLLELSSRNLINLIPTRKHVGELEGYDNEHYVTQHDLLRELAIHQSGQGHAAERERLLLDIQRNVFPTWWSKQEEQCINAYVMSITTDEAFSSEWHHLKAPMVEVLILNIRSESYTLPKFIETMSQLKVLIVTGYGVYPTQLEELQILGSLSSLRVIRLEHVSVSLPIEVIFTLQNIKKLTFVTCKIGKSLNSGTTDYPYMLPNLTHLELDCCFDLTELPEGLCSSVQLQKLIINTCQELDALPKELGNLSKLKILRLRCCTKLQELPKSIEELQDLTVLDISECSSIKRIPKKIGELSGLRVLNISGCQGLEELPVSVTNWSQLEDIICDEETLCLWKKIRSDHSNVNTKLVEEDRLGSFKKICR
uniref:probable disease resistance protein At5g66900 n=1 Tax=Erigeron canadensis TaxID=72917 RepID=UPI001CB9BBD0|nr:probable disease resistance protein At5g66900 [Erigeron canadensis]